MAKFQNLCTPILNLISLMTYADLIALYFGKEFLFRSVTASLILGDLGSDKQCGSLSKRRPFRCRLEQQLRQSEQTLAGPDYECRLLR